MLLTGTGSAPDGKRKLPTGFPDDGIKSRSALTRQCFYVCASTTLHPLVTFAVSFCTQNVFVQNFLPILCNLSGF